jgi:phosphoribosyl 1,2-cyclic phosphodiesterase
VITFSLQSGSNGNAFYVETDRTALLLDAGITCRQIRRRLGTYGRDLDRLGAVVVSHAHYDHVRAAGVVHRMARCPLYVTPYVLRACRGRLGALHDVRTFQPGESVEIADAIVQTIPTPHDVPEAVAFVVESRGRRLGLFTDLGHPFAGLAEALAGVDGAYVESNYDPLMLENGPYSFELKERIRGWGGHISNEEAAELVHACAAERPRWFALAHLSDRNNTPRAAMAAHRRRVGDGIPLHIAGRLSASRMFSV